MMGAWTKQPGETSLYALIRRDAITASRLDNLAAFASSRLGRTITRQQVVRWLRKFASFVGENGGTEYVLFEMPEAQVANLPTIFADRFGTAAELAELTGVEVGRLNDLLGTDQGEL